VIKYLFMLVMYKNCNMKDLLTVSVHIFLIKTYIILLSEHDLYNVYYLLMTVKPHVSRKHDYYITTLYYSELILSLY
jgi:hypothetical protein